MRASFPACRRTKMLICSGFVGHWPGHSLRPASSTTQIAVIFCETSNPTKRVIDEPPTVRITGRQRPDRGTIGRLGANRDYRMSTYGLLPHSSIRDSPDDSQTNANIRAFPALLQD